MQDQEDQDPANNPAGSQRQRRQLTLKHGVTMRVRKIKSGIPKGWVQKKIVEFSPKLGGWGQQWTDFPSIFFFFFENKI